MAEFDPKTGEATFDDQEIIPLTRENTSLYTFWGDLEMYNLVFVMDPNILENEPGGEYYVFNGDDIYDALVKYIQDNNFPQYLNLIKIEDCDVEAFFEARQKEMDGWVV